jgi:WD40 repeat protein
MIDVHQPLLTSSEDKRARLWDLRNGKLVATFANHSDAVKSAAFSPDGRLIATCSYDGSVVLRDIAIGKTDVIRPWKKVAVTALAFNPRTSKLAVGSGEGALATVDSDGKVDHQPIEAGVGVIKLLRFSNDGSHLIVASEDNAVRCFLVQPFRLLGKLLPLPGNDFFTSLPDGSYKCSEGDAGLFWWTIKLCRFNPTELDAIGQPPIVRWPVEHLLDS